MPKYPWGSSSKNGKRGIWLGENGLSKAFNTYVIDAQETGLSKKEAEELACEKITEDWEIVQQEEGSGGRSNVHAPIREDWYWAFEHYGDDQDEIKRKDAPSPFAWSLLVGAWKNDTSWKSLQDKVAKDLFGGDVSDDDDRAFIATGMPSALRERFSGVLAEAKHLLSGQLPEVFGRTEGS